MDFGFLDEELLYMKDRLTCPGKELFFSVPVERLSI